MRTTVGGRNTVDVRPQVFVGGFGPLQRQFNALGFVDRKRERRFVNRSGLALLEHFAQVVNDAIFMEKRFFRFVHVVNENHFDAAMQKTGNLQPLLDRVRIEAGSRKNRRVRRKRNRRAGSANGTFELLQL